MELQELKSVWTKVVDEEHTKYEFDQNKVQKMIQKKSNTILAKIERQLKYKRRFCGIIGSFAILLSPVHFFSKEGSINIFGNVLSSLEIFSITLLFGLALIILYIHLNLSYKKIKTQRVTSESLKITLKKVNNLLNRVMNLTIILDTTIVPCVAFLILYRLFFKDQFFVFDGRVLYIVLGTTITFLFIRYVSKRQQEERLGAFINNLKDCISDIDALGDPKK